MIIAWDNGGEYSYHAILFIDTTLSVADVAHALRVTVPAGCSPGEAHVLFVAEHVDWYEGGAMGLEDALPWRYLVTNKGKRDAIEAHPLTKNWDALAPTVAGYLVEHWPNAGDPAPAWAMDAARAEYARRWPCEQGATR